MAQNFGRSLFLWIDGFLFFLQELIFAIRTDWFFLQGIFAIFRKSQTNCFYGHFY